MEEKERRAGMKINWGFSPLWRENLKRIAIQCEKLSAKPHSKPPFLPFLSLLSLSSPNPTTDITLFFVRSLSFQVKLPVVM